MSTTETVRAWATSNAGNASADAAITSSDAQSPDTIDNNIRSIMAAVKKQMNDIGGSLVAGGSANALTVTTGQVLEAGQITDGLRILLKATADNTSTTVTFAPDGLTAAAIKRADGSALAVGSVKSGMYLDLVYNSGASEWRAANIAPLGVTPAFRAHKNGSDQTVSASTATQITFGTEVFDQGGCFASSAWTPPAGTALISAVVSLTNLSAVISHLDIYKNGAAVAVAYNVNSSTTLSVSFIDRPNGSDIYTLYYTSVTDASYTISGVATDTYFQGVML